MSRKNNNKIDSWIDDETLTALEKWMKNNDRNKTDSVRMLLIKALRLEGLLEEVKR